MSAMKPIKVLENLIQSGPLFRDVISSGNIPVLRRLLGPAIRGLLFQVGKNNPITFAKASYETSFDWEYRREFPEMQKLYEQAKKKQWNASTDINWNVDVDPHNPEFDLMPDSYIPTVNMPVWRNLTRKEKNEQKHGLMSWILSQFLHGEQGAIFASAQVTNSVPWFDAKLFGSSQVIDEGRHVEAFYRYIDGKLNKLYPINDNLYVIIESLMLDSDWDMKFLGMQIMIEGLALGAFGAIRGITKEPLLREMLKYVITDEARHVHFGVLSLSRFFNNPDLCSEKMVKEREDWAFEISGLLRNRFLAHEFYDEYYGHIMSRKEWDSIILESSIMGVFRDTMFKRIIPNLRKIGLLSERIQPYYQELGVLRYKDGKAATEVELSELMGAAG